MNLSELNIENNPIVTLIVPVYNVEKYLRRCVDSVLIQTFSDFELILVNDGSTDYSGMICDEYQMIDSRIKVFHKLNGGLSDARNLGISVAKGRYLTFLDSDDWLHRDFLSIMLNNIDKYNADIAICNLHSHPLYNKVGGRISISS